MPPPTERPKLPTTTCLLRGTITFEPGQTSTSVSVQISGDTLPESNETFFVDLSTSIGASIDRARAKGTIIDDGDVAGEPDFQLLVSPVHQLLPPGGSVSYVISAAGLFGFDEPIELEVLELPDGVTATFSRKPPGPAARGRRH